MQTDRWTDKTDRNTDRPKTNKPTETRQDRQDRHSHADRQDRHTDTQTDKQTDRQEDISKSRIVLLWTYLDGVTFYIVLCVLYGMAWYTMILS